ncbi:MAG: beta-N-acetylhexosaminidase [Caldilineaceae bacterium]|nr:beta-N-acetylhexosaminidase [Caldilineaceae bacterium]
MPAARASYADGPISIIPKPAHMERRPGRFTFMAATAIAADGKNQGNTAYLRSVLRAGMGLPLPVVPAGTRGSRVELICDTALAELGVEGYRLEVTPETVSITAVDPTGVFYGIQTLRQLLPPALERRGAGAGLDWSIPCLVVEDRPRFGWRGFMLDEGRHFHGKETVLRLLDIMALLKMNIFHWHLTEDQGWRIEIRQYPRLAAIGAHRPGTARNLMAMVCKRHDGVPHSGFYTQDEIREIVGYAAERHITIVPEIEMPGHSRAALAAYPELSCTGGPFEVATGFGIFKDIYCVGKETTFAFLEGVLSEVMDLFPGPYLHIGGDEAPRARWKQCPECQQRMVQEGITDAHGLQLYLTNRMARFLDAHGRRLVGWNNILNPGLDASAILQYWVGRKRPIIEAMGQGRQVIISSFLHYYLDHSYSLTSLRKAYEFEPHFAELDAAAAQQLLGVEAPLWAEWVPNRARLEYQVFPRLLAVAETGWSPATARAYLDFAARLPRLLDRLDIWQVGYARGHAIEPPSLEQALGIFTILQSQTKTADG